MYIYVKCTRIPLMYVNQREVCLNSSSHKYLSNICNSKHAIIPRNESVMDIALSCKEILQTAPIIATTGPFRGHFSDVLNGDNQWPRYSLSTSFFWLSFSLSLFLPHCLSPILSKTILFGGILTWKDLSSDCHLCIIEGSVN